MSSGFEGSFTNAVDRFMYWSAKYVSQPNSIRRPVLELSYSDLRKEFDARGA
jgi:hypothetical protein